MRCCLDSRTQRKYRRSMLIYVLFGLAVLTAAEYNPTTGSYGISEEITGLIATMNQIIVSTDGSLLGLTTDLQQGTSFELGTEYESITGVAAYRASDNRVTIVTCLAPGNACAIFRPRNSSDLLSSDDLTYANGIDSALMPLALVPDEESCFAAGFGRLIPSIPVDKLTITQFFYSNESRGKSETYSFTNGKHRRKFLDGFEYDYDTYFVARDPNIDNGLTIVRICKTPPLKALYELNLSSVSLPKKSTLPTIQLVQKLPSVPEAFLLLTVSNTIGTSNIVALKMSDIEKKMEMVYNECFKDNGNKVLTPPWFSPRTCQSFGAVRISMWC